MRVASLLLRGSGPRSRLQISARPLVRNSSSGAKTALYDLHIAHGGRMVDFAGYQMPVQYKSQSIIESSLWTRSKASLFDVSHMLQHTFKGPGAEGFLTQITPSSIRSIQPNRSTLSCFLHPETGTILDDLMISRTGADKFHVVTNAGRRTEDIAHLTAELEKWNRAGNAKVEWTRHAGSNLIALQGPLAASILNGVLASPESADLAGLYFGGCREEKLRLLDGSSPQVAIFRGGYTGEDGFEISLAENIDPHQVVNSLLKTAGEDKLALAGLASRDILRLEAGMCLYGSDLDETTNPAEAALGWIVGKDRREKADFYGASSILPQLTAKSKGGTGPARRRVGLIVERVPARAGSEIITAEGDKIGVITSGNRSPTLEKNIAMAYVKPAQAKVGTELLVNYRGKSLKAEVVKMPFVPHKYYTAASAS